MSFSIGSSGAGMGPRGALNSFGKEEEGAAFNRHVVRRMLGYLRPHRGKMLAALALVILTSALSLAVPYLIGRAIDKHIAVGDLPGLTRISLLIAALYLSLAAATAGQTYLLSWTGQRALASMRDQLFRHLQELPVGYHDTHIIGVTVSRVINDVAAINELLSQGLITLIGDMLVLGGIIVVMFSMSPQLALYTFTVLPVMLLATWLFARLAKSAFRRTRRTIAALVGRLAEDITGMRVIQAFSQEQAARARFEEVNEDNRQANVDAISLSFVFLPSVEFLGMVATGIVLLAGGMAVINQTLTIGVMVAFLAYVTRFFQPIQELSQLYTTLQAAMAGGELNGDNGAAFGVSAVRFVASFNVRHTFISISAMDALAGPTDSSLDEAEFARMLLARGERRYILTDSSKFGRRALIKVCEFGEFETLVTERAPPPDLAASLAATGVSVDVA